MNMKNVLVTLLIVGGLVLAGMYIMRSRRQQPDADAYVIKKEVIKEEVKETVDTPEENSTVTETSSMQVDVK